MTPAERKFWTALHGNRLKGFHFRKQQVIAGFIVDFYCHAMGLAVEVDGPIHERQREEDAARDEALAHHGVRVLRLTNREVQRDLEAALDRIMAACSEFGTQQGSKSG